MSVFVVSLLMKPMTAERHFVSLGVFSTLEHVTKAVYAFLHSNHAIEFDSCVSTPSVDTVESLNKCVKRDCWKDRGEDCWLFVDKHTVDEANAVSHAFG